MMDFQLTSEQRQIQESVRKVMEGEITPILKRNDPNAPLPMPAVKEISKILVRQGLTALRLPESVGGAGMSALNFGIVKEQIPPTVTFLCGEAVALRIYYGGTMEQRERYIPALIKGEKHGATGITEPDTGSDPRGIRTKAVRDGGHIVLNGRKTWISGAAICDLMLVIASTGKDERGFNQTIMIVVDRKESPFVTRPIPTLGFKQGHMGEAIFEDCRVPIRNVIGEVGESSRVLKQTWLVQRPMYGLWAVQMGQKALDAALKYAGERVMFGRKIGGFQLVQELLADASAAVTTSRLLCYYALDCIDKGLPNADQLSAMAKRYAIKSCQNAVSMAMEVHGAMGISCELGLEQLYRDVRMLPIPDGTNQILTLIEGRALTGISAIR